MIKRSVKIVIPLAVNDCFELVKKLGNETKGLKEDCSNEDGIFWTAPNYAFDVWITAISDDKTSIEIISSSNGLFDPFGTLEQQAKIFAVRLRNRTKLLSKFKLQATTLKRKDLKWSSADTENTVFLIQHIVICVLIGIEITAWLAFKESQRRDDYFLLIFAVEFIEPSLFDILGGLIGGVVAGIIHVSSWSVSQDVKNFIKAATWITLISFAPFIGMELIISMMPGPGTFAEFFHPILPVSFIVKVFFSLAASGIVFFLTTTIAKQFKKWRTKR